MHEKRKQHFVPRLHLRKFSLRSQEERINIFNISSLKFIEGAKIDDQAYKKYFYGRDLKIENTLERLEYESANIINAILKERSLPTAHSGDHQILLTFILTLLGRTAYAAEVVNESAERYKKTILSLDLNALPELENDTDPTLTNAVQSSLSALASSFPLARDLQWKLIINETEHPFVTSDHPVVLYNQFLEPRKKYGSNTGIACKGLELFLPLSPTYTLVLFDKDVYKVGSKNKTCVEINNISDVKSLNLLQCINANKNLYFNDKFSENEVRKLLTTANSYRRSSKANLEQYPSGAENGKQKILLHLYGSDVRCSLKLSFIKILKKAKSYSLGQKVGHMRNEQLCRLHRQFLDLVDKGLYPPCDFDEFVRDYKKVHNQFLDLVDKGLYLPGDFDKFEDDLKNCFSRLTRFGSA